MTQLAQRVFAFAAPALYYVMLSSMALTFQLWGGPKELGLFAIMGYLAGLAASGLLLPGLQRRYAARGNSGPARLSLLLCFSALALFPVWGFATGAVIRSLPVFVLVGICVGALLSPSTWLFFVHAPARSRGVLYGTALACAHICWALLSPLVNDPAEGILLQEVAGRYLTLLTTVSGLTGLMLAYVLWRLLLLPAGPDQAFVETFSPGLGAPLPLWPILLPVLLCFFLNGLINYQFLAHFQTRLAVMPEFAHILLAVGLPLLGALLDARNDAYLRRALAVAVLCIALGPVALSLPEASPVGRIVRMACAIAVQVLYFAGTLACAQFAPFGRFPALTACAAWLGIGGAIAGGAAARFVFPALPLSSTVWVWITVALCLVSIVPLLKASLSALPLETEADSETKPGWEATKAPARESVRRDVPASPDPARLASFAAGQDLSDREAQVLAMLARSCPTGAIANALGVSESTVRTYISRLLQKTGASNRATLLALFRKQEPAAPETGPEPISDSGPR